MNRMIYIPREIECFWCGKRMIRGTTFSGPLINHVSYFCKECGAVSHFAVHEVKKIVDGLIDEDKKVAMCDINRAIDKAWSQIYTQKRILYRNTESEKHNKWINEQYNKWIDEQFR